MSEGSDMESVPFPVENVLAHINVIENQIVGQFHLARHARNGVGINGPEMHLMRKYPIEFGGMKQIC
jgi:hypothetical protein